MNFSRRWMIFLGLSLWAGAGSLFAQGLPAAYDLRSVLDGGNTVSWVPDIQDQGYFGDCWTFASATAMDSNLLMNGLFGPVPATPPTIQISSWALSTGNGVPESLIGPNYGGDGIHTWGGFEYQALAYVTRGQGAWAIPNVTGNSTTQITVMGGGPVFDSAPVTPANSFPAVFQNSTPANIANLIPPANQTPVFQTRSVTMLDQGFSNNVPLPAPITPGGSTYNFNLGAADPQVAAVKQAITTFGAVATGMNANSYNFFNYVSNGNGTYTVNYFNPSKNPNTTDHEVTIIGWNDSYQMTDPSTNITYTGAWLVQNSWGKNQWGGTDHPNNGTFWAPYDDAAIGREAVAAFQMGSVSPYSQTVLQNELGPLGYANNFIDGSGILGMAQLSARKVAGILTSTQTGSLAALGLATQVGGVSVQISLYSNWINGSGTLLEQQTATLDGVGYDLIDLDTLLPITLGEQITVVLDYGQSQAAPVVIGGDGLSGYLTVTNGLSYYYDGSAWQDMANLPFEAFSGYGPDAQGGVLFLKGIMAVPEPSTTAWLIAAGGLLAVAARRRRRPLRAGES